jgi:hypothetical protein
MVHPFAELVRLHSANPQMRFEADEPALKVGEHISRKTIADSNS